MTALAQEILYDFDQLPSSEQLAIASKKRILN
ncbi:hypothetical protein SAMN06272755_0598 [Picosynechococcus sp. OG1]|nr:hypothetical protein SAMN06272755_0598 [Picosynechococcus sp. OG1]SMQ84657.1 hypothetical protein SAMN06272774_2972 [Synechococcus sp. 7002]